MTVGSVARSWLRQEVRAFYMSDRSSTRLEGTVVAYSPGPQVLIEAPDGRREWWDAGLCEKTTGTNRRPDHAPVLEADACVDRGADAGGEGYRDDCATPDETSDLARKTVQLGPAGRVARFALDQAEGRMPRPL